MFEVRIHDKEIKQLEKALAAFPRALPKVMSRAINKTAEQARSKITRTLRDETGVKLKEVRKRVLIRRATYSNWFALIKLPIRGIYAYSLGAKQTKKGVSWATGRGGRVLDRHAFIATMPSSHVGVFRRRAATGSEGPPFVGRLPIYELDAWSGTDVWELTQEALAVASRETEERMAKNIAYQVELILKRRAG